MATYKTPSRLTFLGCGHIGKALLGALLPSISKPGSPISDVTVAMRRKESEARAREHFKDAQGSLNFISDENLEAVKLADAVVFAFPPEKLQNVLRQADIKEALRNKIIISLLARTARAKISQLLHGEKGPDQSTHGPQIICAMPTIGTGVHESATLIANSGMTGEREGVQLATWIFNTVGKVFYVSPDYFDAATGLSAFCNGLTNVATQVILQRSVSEGIPAEHAIGIASQCIRGAASLMLSGTSPEELEIQLSAPGSITGQAMSRLRESQLPGILDSTLSAAISRARDSESK